MGFTLLELLAVVVIISLIVGLLLPAVTQGKSRAKRLACMNIMRQVGVALTLYVDDSEKYPPGAVQVRANPTGDDYTWQKMLHPYFVKGAVALGGNPDPTFGMLCPQQTAKGQSQSYGYNLQGAAPTIVATAEQERLGLGRPVNLTSQIQPPVVSSFEIVAPSEMIAMGDIWGVGAANPASVYALVRNPGYDAVSPKSSLPGRLHAGGGNMVFCDAHVDYARQDKWLSSDDAILRLWNKDNEAHRELLRATGVTHNTQP